jgi:hypothetical protein
MLVTLIVLLIICGVALYVISLIPMDATIKKIIQVLVILFVCLYVLKALGLLAGLGSL